MDYRPGMPRHSCRGAPWSIDRPLLTEPRLHRWTGDGLTVRRWSAEHAPEPREVDLQPLERGWLQNVVPLERIRDGVAALVEHEPLEGARRWVHDPVLGYLAGRVPAKLLHPVVANAAR